ncbi:putative ribonuclease toxin of YeeF-YezG toxin-antitoxin module [Gracilibacillus halotolerans]|uniref:Putative ribonuclease toxin of YeeF-YezG toxin-antitoxin module n=3 Tax=Gracilibacillus halotolerans TaxID=74386 RepID=A0A841RIL6_9BACI|nr:T7SS effector LXG polymorphic toxin [Gracilibacillus halotolerans]MBB6514060.1 putative ribonuclease toxin of YeeF-YezG toxin-antitoxin module [Gracilibacillus halotolerans]
MSTTQTLETKTLVEAMESRAKEYRLLRDQFQELKTSFKDIVDLDDFKGKTADSVKGFYRAQIDVVNSWIDFIDLQEAFFKGIKGMADDEDLGGKTLVHLPFLESDLKNSESRARQMVDSQEQALEDIFSGISDIVSLEPNSTKRFDKHIDEATKKRKETKEKVENFDQTLLEFYEQSKYHENVIAGLISELYKASSQGGEVNPLYFNEEAYKKSDVHTAREEAKEITAKYISWQDELERARELENRSFGEKTWDTICTFTGEVTGYYDMKRASTGVDPVTGQVLTDGQRATSAALAAAGFIPFVGWAGRAAKGGHAIYKTSKTFSAADNVLNAYKTTEAFDILKTSERGLYGLASANGFSEFITGRDIFGNPISEEEQQAGFERALLLLPFKGKTANPVLGVRDDARGTSKGAGKYQVGAYKDIKGVEGLDAHHAGQKAAMKKLVDNYDLNTAPAINVPKVGHTIKGPNGIVSRSTKGIDNPRQLLARDIRELRRVYDDIPNSALKELIELNKKMYPEMRK